MNLLDITPVILTFNEEANIGRTLAGVGWASDIVVVDSGSTDGTLEILRSDARVHVVHRPFDTHARQWNFALRETGLMTPWVLALDADHVVSRALVTEVHSLEVPAGVAGFRAPFVYVMDERPLRGSLYPPSIVLFRRDAAQYVQDGHTQRVQLEGSVADLRSPVFHDDRKSLDHWRRSQHRYMTLEARKLRSVPWRELHWPDRLRRCYLGPLLVLPYCLFVKRLLLDGMAGLKYSYQRFYAECVLAARLWSRWRAERLRHMR
jgi:glycosyltransferase involved in cell wall biosynthesis